MMGLLSQYTNLSGEVYKEAVSAVQDISGAMGTDLNSSVKIVGEALNDPIKGIENLSKAGIIFSEDQKNLIEGFVKTNDLASAQGVILDNLEKAYGGTSQKMAETASGMLDQVGNSFEDLLEVTGDTLLSLGKEKGVFSFLKDTFNSATDDHSPQRLNFHFFNIINFGTRIFY